MTRRKLMKSMAPLVAGATVVTEKGAATSSAFELSPEKRYLLVLQPHQIKSKGTFRALERGISETCRQLNQRGTNIHGVVVPADMDLKLYELESDESEAKTARESQEA